MDINDISKVINHHPQLSLLNDNMKISLMREIIHQIVNERLNLFEECLEEVSKFYIIFRAYNHLPIPRHLSLFRF